MHSFGLPVRKTDEDYYLGFHALGLESGEERLLFAKMDVIVTLYGFCFGESLAVGVRLAATQYSQKAIPRTYSAAFEQRLRISERQNEATTKRS